MTMLIHDKEIEMDAKEMGREEGRKEGKKEGIKDGIILTKKIFKLSKEGKIISEIARECDVSEETVRDILE